jgi:hypothetical protein
MSDVTSLPVQAPPMSGTFQSRTVSVRLDGRSRSSVALKSASFVEEIGTCAGRDSLRETCYLSGSCFWVSKGRGNRL